MISALTGAPHNGPGISAHCLLCQVCPVPTGVLHAHHARRTLDDFDVDPETKRVLGVALEKTRVSLGLADDFADGIIAKRLIELAKAGECNPDLLCQGAIEQLRGHLYGD